MNGRKEKREKGIRGTAGEKMEKEARPRGGASLNIGTSKR